MRTWRTTAAVLPPVVTVAALCVLRHPRVVYTSDSTAQQSIVRTWFDVGHGTTHVPPDTWALKVPFYLVLESLPLSPPDKLLAAVLVLNVLTFVLAGLGAVLLAPRARWYELAVPLTWLAALGGGIGSNRMLANYRNIELGLCLLLLGLLAAYLRRPGRTLPWWGWPPVAVLLAVFWFDDPYFMVLVAIPLAALAVLWFWFRDRDRRLPVLAGVLAASVALLPVVQWLAGLGGIAIDQAGQLEPDLLTVWHRDLGAMLDGAAIQFGVERWDLPAWRLAAQVLALAGLLAMLAASTALAVHGWRARSLVPFFVGLHWPIVVAGVLAQENHPSRYLILVVYTLTAATVTALPMLRTGPRPSSPDADTGGPRRSRRFGRVILGVVAVGAVVGLASGAAVAVDAARRPSAALPAQRAVVDAVRATGATKGFAPFWSANITSYLAGKDYTAYELVCDRGALKTRAWLTDTARRTRPARSSYLIWVPADMSGGRCTEAQRDAQLGPPSMLLNLTGGTQVLGYPYDITPRLGP
jgi:hypothetical protein